MLGRKEGHPKMDMQGQEMVLLGEGAPLSEL